MYFFLPYTYKIQPNQSAKETKMKFNKLPNYLNIRLIKGNRNFILYMKKILIMEKSFSRYVYVESMDVISSDVDINEYKLLGTKSKQIVSDLKLIKMPLFQDF